MSKECGGRPIEDAGSSPGGADLTSGESPTQGIERTGKGKKRWKRALLAGGLAFSLLGLGGGVAISLRDDYCRGEERRPRTPTEQVTPLPPPTPTEVIIYPPPTAMPRPTEEVIPTPTVAELIPTPDTGRETEEPREIRPVMPTATSTPEVSAIPEELFPSYGTMLGFNESAGLMITRLPDGSGYLVFFDDSSGLNNLGVYNISSSPESGVYILEQVKGERESRFTRRGMVEMRVGVEGKRIEVKFTLLPPKANPELRAEVFKFTLTPQGTGKKVVYNAIRDTVLKVEHSGPLNDSLITDMLKSNKVVLP